MMSESFTLRESIRDEWSDTERESRRRMAEMLQFSLSQIVVLAELATPKRKIKRPKPQLVGNR